MPAKPTNIDEYLAAVPADQRAVLEKLRKTIRSAVPQAEECLNYGVPAFRLGKKSVAGFGASKNHCSFYPMSGKVVTTLRADLAAFEATKGSIHFTAAKPLPATLVRKLIKARLAEIAALPLRRKTTKTTSTRVSKSVGTATAKKGTLESISRDSAAVKSECAAVIATLKRIGTKKTLDGMARYAIPSDKAFGVPVGELHKLAKKLGKNHQLAAALWESGHYEARMLAAFVDDPAQVTPAQMDRWRGDFDNWAICDTVCFHLFDRSPHAWKKIASWSRLADEFGKRAAFAILASLAGHDKQAETETFVECLPLIERASADDRNFVKKGVSWALRMIGRRNAELNAAAIAVAKRLADATEPAARWIGKDALRELASPAVRKRFEGKAAGKSRQKR